MQEKIIEIQNLSKKFKNADVFSVNDISVDVATNEIYGILGPNGAGKTTLISMLCGLVKPTAGSFKISGFNPKNHLHSIRKIIGIVPQEYALYPTLTAKENLMFFGALYGLKEKHLHEKIDAGLERLGLSEFANRQVAHFSGGMKRRCNLIAGILHNPKVLFLDEPTVGVDVQSKNAIIEFLQELNNNGTTIIYTSHHLTEAQEFCTRIAIMDNGKIHAVGSPEELISKTPNAKDLEDVFIALTGKELRDVV